MITLGEIARRQSLELVGNAQLEIDGLCGLSDDLPRHLSFVAKPKHARAAEASSIPAFVVKPGQLLAGKSCLVDADPEFATALIAALFEPSKFTQDLARHPSAVIHPTAVLGADVQIGPFVAIGRDVVIGARSVLHAGAVVMDRVVIGEDCVLYPHTTVREDCVLGHRVILQPGAAIGGDGYGYVLHEGRHHKIPQLGNVILADDVEIGANATVDRGRFTATRVGQGSKIDNLVMVAHNVQIGEDCLIVSQTGISGSTRLGNRVTLAGQVGVIGHLKVCDDVTVLGKSVIAKHVLNPGVYAGIPMRPVEQWRKAIARFYAQAKDNSPAED